MRLPPQPNAQQNDYGSGLWTAGAQLPPFCAGILRSGNSTAALLKQLPLQDDLTNRSDLSLRLGFSHEVDARRQSAHVIRAWLQVQNLSSAYVEERACACA